MLEFLAPLGQCLSNVYTVTYSEKTYYMVSQYTHTHTHEVNFPWTILALPVIHCYLCSLI